MPGKVHLPAGGGGAEINNTREVDAIFQEAINAGDAVRWDPNTGKVYKIDFVNQEEIQIDDIVHDCDYVHLAPEPHIENEDYAYFVICVERGDDDDPDAGVARYAKRTGQWYLFNTTEISSGDSGGYHVMNITSSYVAIFHDNTGGNPVYTMVTGGTSTAPRTGSASRGHIGADFHCLVKLADNRIFGTPGGSLGYKITRHVSVADALTFTGGDILADYAYSWSDRPAFRLNDTKAIWAYWNSSGHVKYAVVDCSGTDPVVTATYTVYSGTTYRGNYTTKGKCIPFRTKDGKLRALLAWYGTNYKNYYVVIELDESDGTHTLIKTMTEVYDTGASNIYTNNIELAWNGFVYWDCAYSTATGTMKVKYDIENNVATELSTSATQDGIYLITGNAQVGRESWVKYDGKMFVATAYGNAYAIKTISAKANCNAIALEDGTSGQTKKLLTWENPYAENEER